MESPYFETLTQIVELPAQAPARPVTLEEDSFFRQWELITCPKRAICLMCSRRAGKTDGLYRRTAKRSAEEPGRRTLYIHHTRELAKQQFFEPLLEFLRAKGIAIAHVDMTALRIILVNKSEIRVIGCDKEKEVGKGLGFKWHEIIIDECQEFKDHVLSKLVNKTILPTLIDKAGSLILAGTPADVEIGLWYDAVIGKGEYHPLHWTLLENPYIDIENVISTMAIQGYKVDLEHPDQNDVLVQREILGMQVVDRTKLVYCYRDGVNDWPASGIPHLDVPTWHYAAGIDIGGAEEGNDRDAMVVWGWMTNDPEHRVWERESWEEKELDSEEFTAKVLDTLQRWRPMVAVCGDTGGAGANKDLKFLSRRFGGMQFTPKPTSVDLSTRLLNDELRSGRMKLDPLGLVARDCKLVMKTGTYHSDIMAAGRYGYHGVYNYRAKPDDKKDGETVDQAIRRRRREQWQQERKQLKNPWTAEGGWRT